MADPTTFQPVPFEDRYEIRRQLWLDGAHGGWLAFDRLMRREVILNIPYRPDDNERFLFAAQLRARLRHASLIPIYDFNVTSEGKPYFTDPYLETLDLRAFPCDEPDSALPKRIRFLLHVCDALGFVHANNLLHLDLQPSNVLITQPFEEVFLIRGHPSLPAAVMASENDNMLGARIVGTPAYMAPEQAHPDRFGPATARTDVYGLGGILYFVLYGNSPNVGQTQTARDIRDIIESLADRKGPPSPGRLQFTQASPRELAKRLEPICQRALHSD
ncbi:MAG: protein kinase domain-containing protein, partial [Pirellula sp.]